MAISNWSSVYLEDLADEITVGHVGSMASEYISGGIPFLRSKNVDLLRLELSDLRFISNSFHDKLSKSSLSPGDVVIVRTGKPGTCAVIPQSLPTANCSDLVIVRPGPDLDSRFLAYYINSVAAHHINAQLVGAVQQHFNVGSARKLLIHLPRIQEQRAIAHILGTLDDKIELNRRMNQTLEEMAQAIFKSWFVDFDPVKAKAAAAAAGKSPAEIERAAMAAISGKTESELDSLSEAQCQSLAQTAALFPASFVDSELGEIPEGWEVLALDEIAHYQNGLALQKYRPKPGEAALPIVKIAQLKKGESTKAELASVSIKPECILDTGDVVFSWSGSLLVTLWCGGKAALNQHLFKVTSGTFPKWFYFYWTKKHLAEFQRIASGKAVTMGHIKRSHLTGALCSVPSQSVLEGCGAILEPLLDQMISIQLQSRTLAQLRDTLLPKLLSGELSVAEISGRTEEDHHE